MDSLHSQEMAQPGSFFLYTIEDLALEGKEALAQLQAQQVHLGVRLPQADLEILSYHHLK